MSARRASRLAPLTLVMLCGVLVTGCGEVVDGAPAEVLGTSESPLSLARWYASWGTVDGPDLDLGPSTDRTCFLAGVAGNLNAGWGWDHPGRYSEASVSISGGRWVLTAQGGRDYGNAYIGNPVNAHAVCIGTTANRIIKYTGGAGGSVNNKVLIAPATANRQCFLRSVTGYSGTWYSSSAWVRVYQENGNWYLESDNLGTSAGIPSLGAVCVDVPAGTWVGTGAWGVGNPGSLTVNVGYEGGAMVCGLTGVQGPLRYNNWTDGAMITWPASSPGIWTMSLKNGKTGYVTCMQ